MKFTSLSAHGVKSVDEMIDNYKQFTHEVFEHLIIPMSLSMTNTFNRKKSAWQLRHRKNRNIGSIDVSKLYAYRTSDDIFKKKSWLPNGKNHGVVVLIDMSSSMFASLPMCLINALALVEFCKRNKIECEVLTFTKGGQTATSKGVNHLKNAVGINEGLESFKLFDHTMSTKTLKNIMFSVLLELIASNECKNIFGGHSNRDKIFAYLKRKQTMFMGNTPLASALWLGIERCMALQERCQQVTMVTISDGAGNTSFLSSGLIFTCPYNKRTYTISDLENRLMKKFVYRSFDRKIDNGELKQPLMMNKIASDLGINSIQINLTSVFLYMTYPLTETDKDNLANETSIFRKKGHVTVENCLGFKKTVFINQRIFNELSSTKNEQTEKSVEGMTDKELKKFFAERGGNQAILKETSNAVITELCEGFRS